jgi:hypothetical protein
LYENRTVSEVSGLLVAIGIGIGIGIGIDLARQILAGGSVHVEFLMSKGQARPYDPDTDADPDPDPSHSVSCSSSGANPGSLVPATGPGARLNPGYPPNWKE